MLTVAEVATWIVPGSAEGEKPSVAAQFQAGSGARPQYQSADHTRLPRYVRGKVGTIARVTGVDAFPDAVAQGLEKKPQHVYSVRFATRELWGEQANPHDAVYLAVGGLP